MKKKRGANTEVEGAFLKVILKDLDIPAVLVLFNWVNLPLSFKSTGTTEGEKKTPNHPDLLCSSRLKECMNYELIM